ncbi:16S rRNA (cytosine(967)-C(5))-methyltransferase RsmB [Azohydromonas caseinilytica]|uniref:16S rRNA (cytosine(967)-C(5))-methyltransferase n=1 Tax=Azohydromonas caseinilytica TaxID=2728836 RepID=A0A848FCT5_9BURK|nr:16S rRNA (cytosine(967)-C(5))-methyltransferase RsmB [Azohydromonas caseinilytica]NML16209.1 16S rRNA (cytosine(967)-C(5))-methyltransferase RsmB [Azohydromonas caseinilytica]
MSSSPTSLPLARLLGHTADALAAVRAGRSLTEVLASVPAEARAGTQALSFDTLRRLGAANAARARLAPKTPPAEVDALLTTALALLWPPEVYAPHVLVDQAVKAVRKRSPNAAGFVNAVLRRFLRERDQLVADLQRDPVAAYSHPAWWIERVRQDWPEQWSALLRAANERPPMTLRVNARRGDAAGYVRRLADAGLAARAIGPHAVLLEQPAPVTQLPGFADGDVSVQDLSAQRAAPLLLGLEVPGVAPLPAGARVLDACAAPGGKTAHLLELADLELVALDADPQRLGRVRETLDRLGLQAELKAADGRRVADWWDGRPFDAILLDAPCSASGVVRRHPDARWLRRPADVAQLVKVQAGLLDALWPLLKPGGRLVYATCSLFKAEGAHQVDAFLQRQGAQGARLDPASPGHLLPLADNAPSDQVPPGDGFYYALLHKP